jgi:hypothetical protein
MSLLKKLLAPTPKIWRQIGNVLLIISTTITGYTAYIDQPTIALISMICGLVGKLITSLVTDDTTTI